MFKWMISGHKNHKHKGKLNNALNNSNCNGITNKPQQKPKPPNEQDATEAADNKNNNNFSGNYGAKEWSQSHQNLSSSQELLDGATNEYSSLDPIPHVNGEEFNPGQRMRSVEHINTFSSFKPTVNGSNGHLPPPLPNPRANGQVSKTYLSSYHLPSQEPLPQAPGTCTLPRRALNREDGGAKIRSPSNPASNSRIPPPYSRHQPPEPSTPRTRRPYQPPPPPRHQESFERLPANKCSPELEASQLQPLTNGYHSWKDGENWQNKDPDSGFESIPAQTENHGNFRLQTERVQNIEAFNHSDNIPSKSSENLINASKVTEGTFSRKICSPSKPKPVGNPVGNPTRPDKCSSYEGQNSINHSQILQSDSVYPATESFQAQISGNIADNNVYHLDEKSNGTSRIRLNGYSSRNIGNTQQSGPNTGPESEYRSTLNENRHDLIYNKPDSPYKYASTMKQYQAQYCDIEVKRSDSFHQPGDGERSSDGWKSLYIKEPQDTVENTPSWMPRVQTNANQRQNRDWPPKQNCVMETANASQHRDSDVLKVTDVRPSLRYTATPAHVTANIKDATENTQRNVEDREIDGCPSSTSWSEWTNQLQAYVSWTNSQLRKKSGSELISDLRRDFLNGIVFGDIIEVIAGEKVSGINKNASSPQQCRDNLDRILQFMAAKRIRMTNITSKEIVEGNIKSIMRVILALASHYKPQSVRGNGQTSDQTVNQVRRTSEMNPQRVTHDIGVGPDAPASAPENTPSLMRKSAVVTQDDPEPILRRQPSLTSTVRSSSPVYENLPKRPSYGRWAYDSLRASHKFQWNPKDSHDSIGSKHLETESVGSSFNNSLSRCPSLNVSLDDEVRDSKANLNQSKPAALEFWKGLQIDEDGNQKPQDPEDSSPFRYHTVHRMSGRRKLPQIPGKASPCSSASRVTTPQGDIFSIDEIPKSVQSTSLCGSINDDETSREPEGRSQNSSPAASIVRGSLIESWRGMNGLENWKDKDNFATKGNQISSYGTMDNNMKNTESAALRQEVIRHIIARQALETDKGDLSRNLQQRENLILELRQQLNQKDKTVQTQKLQLEETVHQLQNGKLNRPSNDFTSRGQVREELQLVRGAIGALRANFRDTDPNQHTLDTLEQAIAVLMERAPSNVDTLVGNKRDKPISNKIDCTSTKIIYFTERTVTPFMSTINKRIGEITLRDFKAIFDRPGFYRFHFKNHDPEYGLVKEEIINDDEILPGIDGKIIAWVEDEVE